MLVFVFSEHVVLAQLKNSPYVETLTGIINNTGFKSTSLRSTPVTKPTPVHLSTDALNRSVAPRFVVAKTDCIVVLNSLFTWAAACGWTTTSNTSSSGNIASPATGCHAYSEVGAGAGTWRLPTQRELMIIYLMRKELLISLAGFVDFVTDGTPYWSSSSNSTVEAWSMSFSDGVMYNRAKTSTYKVRCIRDL